MERQIIKTTKGVPVSDGAGVKLTRIIASPELEMLDPLLLLDYFESENPNDYIGGFPPHPHRGFETVTYMLAGRMRHKDNAGNEGVIETGGVQWMSAGRGIVHSEMPEQESGLMKGFQLWINLPASHKMAAPAYQEFNADMIPQEVSEHGGVIRVIYLDISLRAGEAISQAIPESHNAVVFVIEGEATIGDASLKDGTLGTLGPGMKVSISSEKKETRFLLIAGQRLEEPVARGGPFVMNTRQELLQAFEDYHRGRF